MERSQELGRDDRRNPADSGEIRNKTTKKGHLIRMMMMIPIDRGAER